MDDVNVTAQKENKLYQSFKHYFGDKNISTQRLLVASVIHEVIGLSLMTGLWYMCYKFEPIGKIMRFLPLHYRNHHKAALEWSNRRLNAVPLITRISKSPERLIISGSESFILRKFLLPVTIPAKLYLAFTLSGVIYKPL